jgi:hypothetical protein
MYFETSHQSLRVALITNEQKVILFYISLDFFDRLRNLLWVEFGGKTCGG